MTWMALATFAVLNFADWDLASFCGQTGRAKGQGRVGSPLLWKDGKGEGEERRRGRGEGGRVV